MIDLQSQLDGLSSYESNAQDGISWENTASSAMSSMNEVAQRVRELLVQAANGTNNQSDLETMALQVEQLTESVKQDANTQYAGQYVFSGTATTTAPYEQGENDEYKGNAETVSRAVGPGASVTITTNISTLLGERRSRRRRQAARHAAHDRQEPARRHGRRQRTRSAPPTCRTSTRTSKR